ncbi:hypothetical protein [Priestia megaterium]|uniref:hypothetical protein n=1 Tax=Priestia megaterium TaxID=1404 RepID=UPI003AAB0339
MNTATDFSSTAFRKPHTLKQHIFDTLHFYYPACIDQKNGGYIHEYYDDGTVNNTHSKHLVSTARFIYIFSVGALYLYLQCRGSFRRTGLVQRSSSARHSFSTKQPL